MKEWIKELGYTIESKLRGLCGEITPDKRLVVILIMLLCFTALSLYFSISSIYNWGKDSERKQQIQIEHLRRLQLECEQRDYEEFIDSEIGKRFLEEFEQEMERDSIENAMMYEQQNRNKNG